MFWFRRLFRRAESEVELNEEIRFYLDQEVQLRIDRGASRRDAIEAARRDFGNLTLVKEATRHAWGWMWLESLFGDIRLGTRMLWRSPAFTAAALLSLTLGIGASCAIFGVLHPLLLMPLPFREAENLVAISQTHPRLPKGYKSGTSLADLADWRSHSVAFEDFTASDWRRHHLLSGDASANINGLRVASNFFSLLGVNAALGRTFAEDDFRLRRKVVVLSHRLWSGRFARDPGVIGRTIRLDDEPYEIIGVMPPAFQYPPGAPQVPGMICQTWEPMVPSRTESADRGFRSADVLARLRPGYRLAAAKAELDAVLAQLAQKYPESNAGWTANLTPLADEVTAGVRPALLLLAIAVFLVLLLACANVANLFLARAAARHWEIGLRVALGAGRLRLLSQSIVENFILAALGGVLGLIGAHWALQAIVPSFPHSIPRIDQIGIHRAALLAAAPISLGTAVLIALVPSLAFRRLEPAQALQSGSGGAWLPGSFRLSNAFVVAQVAVSLVLLVGAGLMIRTLVALETVDMGFRPDSVLTVRINPPGHRYRSWEQVHRMHRQLLEEVQSRPGVASAALVMNLPLSGRSVKVLVAGQSSGPELRAERNVVSRDYFRVMRIPLWRGRVFGESDGASSTPVVIINRGLARQLWPGGEPLGRELRIGAESRTVIGVVEDEKHSAVDQAPEPKFYVAYDQDRSSHFLMSILTFLVIRTTGDPLRLVAPARQAVWAVDKAMPADDVQTMRQLVDDSIAVPRFRTMLLGVLAFLALTVSMLGVYGVMAYSVSRRRRDIGIRMALGAGRRCIVSMILLDGLRLALIGTALGLGLSAALTRLLQSQLFGVQPLDLWAFGGAAVLMLTIALLACLIPAYSAARLDPLTALRYN